MIQSRVVGHRCTTAVACVALLAACSGDLAVSTGARTLPTVTAVAVTANASNVLALDATVTVLDADSVRLRMAIAGETAERVTPASAPGSGAVSLTALGLPEDTAVSIRAEAFNARGATRSAPVVARTGALPSALRGVRLAITGTPTPGYLLTSVIGGGMGWAVAFDSAGTLAWYHAFPEVTGVFSLEQQPDGNFTVFVGLNPGGLAEPGHFAELSPAGDVVRTYDVPAGYYGDGHELRLVGAPGAVPTAYYFGIDFQPTDLTGRGGDVSSQSAWHSIFRKTPDGVVTRLFGGYGNFTVADWIEPPLTGIPDIDHPNSLDVLPDGDLLVSWRNLGQITRIDPATGAIRWRLGGTRSDFRILGDPLGGFSGQHDARMLPDGHILLYDNGIRHAPSESRAVEYALDELARTATMVWEYRETPPVFAIYTGAAQRRANGNTVVAHAWLGGVTEVNAAGTVLWRGQVMYGADAAAQLYRIQKIASLYEYRRP